MKKEYFSTKEKQSFVSWQDFLWVANDVYGNSLCEYNPKTHIKNDFYKINKETLESFGIFGHGVDLYFDVQTGKFNLGGMEYLISYLTEDGIEYNLTGYNNGLYNDIITYKDAWTDAKLINDGKFQNQIHQYNFGFKKKLSLFDNTEFALQVVCSVPYNKGAYFEIKLVPNKDLKGSIIIKRIGRIAEPIKADLKEGYAWIGQWAIH